MVETGTTLFVECREEHEADQRLLNHDCTSRNVS